MDMTAGQGMASPGGMGYSPMVSSSPVSGYGGPPAQPTNWSNTGGTGIDWGNVGNLLGGIGSLYGGFTGAQAQQGVSNAAQAGYGMARNAYNPSLFGGTGVGGTGFSVSSPSGGPGSISTSLGAFNPMYGQYAGAAGNFLGASSGLANTASSGATGAYQNALASIMPQLSNMQNNLLTANNNALFQRGQLGSGSFGQYGNANNPTNLTTSSLAQGFGLQDLNAITAAQNQGLNFFNSNLQGAGALGNLGFGATNAGMGMIGAQNALGAMPLAYSGLYGNQQIGSTMALGNMIRSANNASAPATGYGSLANMFGAGGGGGIGGLINQGQNLYNDFFGGGGAGVSGAIGSDVFGGAGPLSSFGTDTLASTGGVPDWLAGTGLNGGLGFSPAGGAAAAGAGDLAAGAAATDLSVPNAADLGLSYIGAPDATAAAGGGASTAGGMGALGAAGLAAALFGGQYALFNAQSQNTPGQQYRDIEGQLSNPNTPATAADVYQFAADQWNPAIQNFNQIPGARAGSIKTLSGNSF